LFLLFPDVSSKNAALFPFVDPYAAAANFYEQATSADNDSDENDEAESNGRSKVGAAAQEAAEEKEEEEEIAKAASTEREQQAEEEDALNAANAPEGTERAAPTRRPKRTDPFTSTEKDHLCYRLPPEDLLPTYFPDSNAEVTRSPRWDLYDDGVVNREFAPEPESKYESTIYCKDTSAFNQSCIVRNAYMVPGVLGIQLFTVGDKQFPKMRMSAYGGEKFGDGKRPGLKRFKSVKHLEDYMATQKIFEFTPLTLNIKIRYQFNWAHAFFDGLYPAFIALAKFGRYREPYYTFLDSHEWDSEGMTHVKTVRGFYSRFDPCKGHEGKSMVCKVREAVRMFGAIGDVNAEYLTWQVARECYGHIFRFNELILGSGAHGQRMATTQLSNSLSMKYLHKGVGLLPIFKERLMMSFGLAPPRRSSSNEGRDPQKPLHAYIADNERFTYQNKMQPRLAALEDYYKRHCERIRVTFIRWRNYDTWAKQMKMVIDTDIWVTSVGSAQYYGVLLSDGSALLQLGHADSDLKTLPHYGEEFILASNPYIRVVHLPFDQIRRGPNVYEIAAALEHTADLIRSDFKVPSENPHEQLSVYAKLVLEATRRDPFFKVILTGIDFDVQNPANGNRLTPKHTGNCPRKYPAEIIFETQKMKNNCFLREDVLYELKQEFNLTGLLEIEPTGKCIVCVEKPGRYKGSRSVLSEMPSPC